MRPDLVNKNVGFKRPHPKRPLLSFLTFPFYDFASYEVDQYTVISPEWKSAIESVEPGVHEFFPLNVVFKDAIISRFIFRERQNIIFFPEGQIVDPYDVLSPNRVKVRRSVLEGRHWVPERKPGRHLRVARHGGSAGAAFEFGDSIGTHTARRLNNA